MSSGRRRPRVLVFNQYYAPGLEATAQLLTQLCEGLAEDFEITVVTGRVVHAPEPGRFEQNGVTVVRVNSTAYDRRRLLPRAINYLSYMAQSLRVGIAAKRPGVVLCMTDPPVIANVALLVARRFRAPLVVISQDVFPEVAVELKRLDNKLLIAALRWLIGSYLARADRVVAIGETMKRRLVEKGARGDRVEVVPNWVDTASITPAPQDNVWSREQGLAGRFVVMHSGNVGHAHDLDVLVRAATFLRDLDDLEIVVIGGGARLPDVSALSEVLETQPVRFLGYQPRETLSLSLSAASIHYVGLGRGLSGFVVPSRLYGILAAGRPVIASADADSETAIVVREIGCGIVIPPGRPELLATELRRAHDGEYDLDEMGRRGREWVVGKADRRIALDRYRHLLQEVVDA